jgi:hypothetical protein
MAAAAGPDFSAPPIARSGVARNEQRRSAVPVQCLGAGPSAPQPAKAAPGILFVVNNPTFLSGSSKEADQFIRFVKKGLEELANRS